MRAIIIDDDRLEMEQFMSCINWDLLGIEIAGIAENGVTGLQLYHELLPDIVITDIQMPGMRGIEVAERIRAMDLETRIIFLSSYEVFEYAYSGFKLDVSDYILKQELFEKDYTPVLQKAKDELIQKRRNKKENTEQAIDLYLSEDRPNQAIHPYEKVLSKKYNCLALFENIPPPPFQNIFKELYPAPLNYLALKAVFEDQKKIFVIQNREDGFLLFVERESREELTANELLKFLHRKTNSGFKAIEFGCHSILAFSEEYKRFKTRLNQRFFCTQEILSFQDLTEELEEDVRVDEEYLNHLEIELDIESVLDYIDHIFQPLIKNKAYRSCSNCLYILYQYLRQRTETLAETRNHREWITFEKKDIPNTYVFQDFIQLIKNKFTDYYLQRGKLFKMNLSSHVEKSIQYIYRHYQNPDLNAQIVAGYISISPTRLRAVFKRDMGIGIHEFITNLRMDSAKHELASTNHKMDEIANRVGYSSGKYFSRAFKTETGLTPEEYRQQERKINNA